MVVSHKSGYEAQRILNGEGFDNVRFLDGGSWPGLSELTNGGMTMNYKVAVLGASSNPERYSFKAVQMLSEHAYGVFPVHPSERAVNGIPCFSSLSAIQEPLDTVTVYLSEKNSTPLIEEIIACAPRRVILNPGAESAALTSRCRAAGIQVQEACTLVLIRTGQF